MHSSTTTYCFPRRTRPGRCHSISRPSVSQLAATGSRIDSKVARGPSKFTILRVDAETIEVTSARGRDAIHPSPTDEKTVSLTSEIVFNRLDPFAGDICKTPTTITRVELVDIFADRTAVDPHTGNIQITPGGAIGFALNLPMVIWEAPNLWSRGKPLVVDVPGAIRFDRPLSGQVAYV